LNKQNLSEQHYSDTQMFMQDIRSIVVSIWYTIYSRYTRYHITCLKHDNGDLTQPKTIYL